MKYDLKKPCDNCPFRKKGGVRLTQARIKEIATMDGEFPCHKTIEYKDTVDEATGDAETAHTKHTKHCAGFLLFREKTNRTTQMMRIMERIGLYDAQMLGKDRRNVADIFDSLGEMLRVNREVERGCASSVNAARKRRIRDKQRDGSRPDSP